MNELPKKIESILFASGKGITVADLAEYTESTPSTVTKALKELQTHYERAESSLIISTYQDKWKLTVKSAYTKYIQNMVSETELAPGLLKTLAVIAYKSPVIQSDIVNIRGQISYDHIKQLTKEKFITKEDSGRSYMLKITDKFYNYFDVEGDEEIREVFSQLRSQQERRTAIENEIKQQEQQKQLGNLEVVDVDTSKDHDKIFDSPVRKEKSDEQKRTEKDFLSSIDDRINSLANRVEKQSLPKKEDKEEEDYL